MTRKPGADQHPSAGRGGKAAERLKMFHEARGIPLEPVMRDPGNYSAAVSQAITAAESAGPGAAGLPQWRFLGPDLIPNGQTPVSSRQAAVSGRVSAIAIDPANRNHLLCGSAGGGIWESFTRGAGWAPRTDFACTLTTGAIAFDPNNAKNNTNIVYAGTGEGNSYWFFGQGFLKSADGGKTWALLPGRVVTADGTLVTDKPFVGVGFFAIIIDPGDSQHILAATRGQDAASTAATASAPAVSIPATGGVYESVDGGATWSQVYAAQACWDISMQPGGCSRQPDGTRTGEVLAATSDGLLRSGDGGHTWPVPGQPDPPSASRVQLPGAPPGWTRLAVSISPADPAVAYAFGASGDYPPRPYLWRRSSSGWSTLSTPAPVDPGTGKPDAKWTTQAAYDWYAAAAPAPFPAGTADQVYLGAKRVFRGDLAADDTWTVADLSCKPQGDCIHDDQHAIAFDPGDPAAIYCSCDGGVFRSPDRGISWVPLNSGLGITEITYMVHDNATSRWLLAGTQDNGTLRYLGTSVFELADTGDGGDCGIDQTRTPDPATGQMPPATCYDTFINMWIERSTRGGAWGTFIKITPKLPSGYQSLFYPPVGVYGSTVAIAGQSVFISRDTGTNWTEVTLPVTGQTVAALYLLSSDLVYAASTTGRVYTISYANGGWTATEVTRPRRAYVSAIRAFAVPGKPDRIWITMSQVGDGTAGNGQVFRSDDGGTTWTDTTKNLPQLPVTSIAFDDTNADRVWVSADVGVYQSLDGGGTWSAFFQGLPYVIVEDLEFHPAARVLRAGTRSRGIWEVNVDPPYSAPPPPSAKACSVLVNRDGGFDAFCVRTDAILGHVYRTSPNSFWQTWAALSVQEVSSALATATNQNGNFAAFWRGTDGTLCWIQQQDPPSKGWNGGSLGGFLTGNPAVARNQDGRLEVFARGSDGALYRLPQSAANAMWTGAGWSSLGGVITSTPAAMLDSDGLLEVFARGTDGGLRRIRQTAAGNWSGSAWESLGGTLAGNPVVQRGQDGHLEVFARGPDAALWHLYQTAPGSSWSAWESLGGTFAGDPAVISNKDGGLQAFVRWTDNELRDIWQPGPYRSWSGWNPLGGTPLSSDPAAMNHQSGRMWVFARGTDNTLWQCMQSDDGWQWASLGGALLAFP